MSWYQEPNRHSLAAQGIHTGRSIRQTSSFNSVNPNELEIRQLAARIDELNARLQDPLISDDDVENISRELADLESKLGEFVEIVDDGSRDNLTVEGGLLRLKDIASRGLEAIKEGGEAAWRWEQMHWPAQKDVAKAISKKIGAGAKAVAAAEFERRRDPVTGEIAIDPATGRPYPTAFEKQKGFVKDIFLLGEGPTPSRELAERSRLGGLSKEQLIDELCRRDQVLSREPPKKERGFFDF
jgi:hypothetical protein